MWAVKEYMRFPDGDKPRYLVDLYDNEFWASLRRDELEFEYGNALRTYKIEEVYYDE